LIASHPHIEHILRVLASFTDDCGHMGAPLLCYINEAWSDFGNSGSLSSVNDATTS